MEKKHVNSLTNEQYEDIFKAIIACGENETSKRDGNKVKTSESNSTKVELKLSKTIKGKCGETCVASQPGLRDTETLETNHKLGFKKEKLNLCIANFQTDNASEKRKTECLKAPKLKLYDVEGYGCDLWVQCSKQACAKWRRLGCVSDTAEVIEEWTCEINTDTNYNSCHIQEEEYRSDSGMETEFNPGFLVWAKQYGYPWWPGMIENDPVTNDYFLASEKMIVMKYHVTFFDDVSSRSWIPTFYIKPFQDSMKTVFSTKGQNSQNWKRRIVNAVKKANSAVKMDVQKRLDEFGFSNTYHKGAQMEYDTDSFEDSERECLPERTLKRLNKKTKRLKKDNGCTEKQEPCKPPRMRKKTLGKSSKGKKEERIKSGKTLNHDKSGDFQKDTDFNNTNKTKFSVKIVEASETSADATTCSKSKKQTSAKLKITDIASDALKKEMSADLKKEIKEKTCRGKINTFTFPRAHATAVDTKSVVSKLDNEAPEGMEIAYKNDKTEDTKPTSAQIAKSRPNIKFQLPVLKNKTRNSVKNSDEETAQTAKNDKLYILRPQLCKKVKKHDIYTHPTVQDREVLNMNGYTHALESNHSEHVNNSDVTSDTKLVENPGSETLIVTNPINKTMNVNDKMQTKSMCSTKPESQAELGEKPNENVKKVPIQHKLENSAFNKALSDNVDSDDFEFNIFDSYTENESASVMQSSTPSSPVFHSLD